jgi:hypothetical protein
LAVLDPRISYAGLRSDCDGDPSALEHIDLAKTKLHEYYLKHNMNTNKTPGPQRSPTSSQYGSPQKVDFLSRYNKSTRTDIDEFEEFLKLPQENFATCDPVQWWSGRRAQFPNLSQRARDILAIPGESESPLQLHVYMAESDLSVGSAVAVERIFSGGRDTISLRRASLKPEMIRTLMLVKQRLRLARTAIQELIGDD